MHVYRNSPRKEPTAAFPERVEEKKRRGEERRGEERRGERREDDPGLKFPDWRHAWGVVIFAMYVSRVCVRVRGSYQVFWLAPGARSLRCGHWRLL